MDNVLGLAQPALRRFAIFFIGIVVAIELLAAVGSTTASDRGLSAGSGKQVTTLATGSPSKRWKPPPPRGGGGGCGNCK